MRRAWLVTAALLGACVPAFEEQPGLVDRPRVLAIRAEPAEAAPGETVLLEALTVGPDGPVSTTPAWALCLLPRPLALDAPVDQACLDPEGPWLVPLAAPAPGAPVAATLPEEACALFGPEPAAPEPGQPALRPVDPDPTGGWYQPLRVLLPEADAAIGRVRLRCELPHVPVELAAELRAQPPNRNPGFSLSVNGPSLVASVDDGAAERYLRYDAAGVALATETEELRLSWFSTAGTLSPAVSAATAGTDAGARLTLPPGTGDVHVWAVLRDDRGGVTWRHAVAGAAP